MAVLAWVVRVIFLSPFGGGPGPAAGYCDLDFTLCSGICRPEPERTHATANRQSLGRFDGRAAVSVERWVRIEVMGSSKSGECLCHSMSVPVKWVSEKSDRDRASIRSALCKILPGVHHRVGGNSPGEQQSRFKPRI